MAATVTVTTLTAGSVEVTARCAADGQGPGSASSVFTVVTEVHLVGAWTEVNADHLPASLRFTD